MIVEAQNRHFDSYNINHYVTFDSMSKACATKGHIVIYTKLVRVKMIAKSKNHSTYLFFKRIDAKSRSTIILPRFIEIKYKI